MTKFSVLKEIAKNLKAIRKKNNLSLKELAKMSGVRVEYLEKIEHAKAKNLTFEKLCAIAAALGAELRDVFYSKKSHCD